MNEYEEVKAEYEEANANIEKLKPKAKKQYEKVVAALQGERKFIGYKVMHNYRADNFAGVTMIGNTIFFIDKDFEDVTFSIDAEEYNQVQEAINQFKEQIEEFDE